MEADVKFSEAQIEAVRRAFPADWAAIRQGEDPSDWANDCLTWRAETVEEVFGWGAGEPFGVRICGIPGAYFVRANEFDNVGIFTTIEEAREGRDWAFAGLELFDTEDAAQAYAEEQGYC